MLPEDDVMPCLLDEEQEQGEQSAVEDELDIEDPSPVSVLHNAGK